MTLPTPVVQVAWELQPFDVPDDDDWTDITADLIDGSLSIRRGRDDFTSPFGAGSASFKLMNSSDQYTSFNEGSPYYPNVRSMRQIRIGFYWDNVFYSSFVGYVQKWTPTEDIRTGMRVCAVECSDAQGALLQRQKIGNEVISNVCPSAAMAIATSNAASTSYPITVARLPTPGNRKMRASFTGTIATVGGLSVRFTGTAVGGSSLVQTVNLSGSNPSATTSTNYKTIELIEIFPTAGGLIATGDVGKEMIVKVDDAFPSERINHAILTLLSTIRWDTRSFVHWSNVITRPYELSGESAWSAIQRLADSEIGPLFIDRIGRVAFLGRQYERNANLAATFGQSVGLIDWQDLRLDYGERYIFNSARSSHPVWDFVASDPDSIDEYGPREYLLRQSIQLNERDLRDMLAFLVYSYRDQRLNIPSLVPAPTEWPTLLSLELRDRVNVALTEDIVLPFRVEKIAISHRSTALKIELGLSSDILQGFWQLGVPGRSELGVSTRLGY